MIDKLKANYGNQSRSRDPGHNNNGADGDLVHDDASGRPRTGPGWRGENRGMAAEYGVARSKCSRIRPVAKSRWMKSPKAIILML